MQRVNRMVRHLPRSASHSDDSAAGFAPWLNKDIAMNLRTLMQVGPTKANELFAKLAETSDGAVKTREKLFAELKGEL